jgi:hypothetical protein
MASFSINNPVTSLTMDNFRGVMNQYGSLAKSCRFIARIVPVGGKVVQINQNSMTRDLMYLCESAELPGRGMMSVDVRYYGPSFKLPFNTSYEDANMTFLCRADSFERQFFDDWMYMINPNNTFDFSYRDDYKCNIEMFQFSDGGAGQGSTAPKPTYAFTLLDAWPTQVAPQAVTWADDQFLRLGISFTYHWWVRRGHEPEGRVDNNIVNQSSNIR